MPKRAINKTKEQLLAMDDFALCEEVWSHVVDEFEERGIKWWEFRLHTVDFPESLYSLRLPENWRVCYLIHTFEYDNLKGGLREFFYNQRGFTNKKTQQAFKRIGATSAGEVFREACGEYDVRRAALEGQDDDEAERAQSELDRALAPLTKRLRSLPEEETPRVLLASFIRANLDAFV